MKWNTLNNQVSRTKNQLSPIKNQLKQNQERKQKGTKEPRTHSPELQLKPPHNLFTNSPHGQAIARFHDLPHQCKLSYFQVFLTTPHTTTNRGTQYGGKQKWKHQSLKGTRNGDTNQLGKKNLEP